MTQKERPETWNQRLAFQCESAGAEKGEYLPPGLHSTAATLTTASGEPRGNSENEGLQAPVS